MKKQTHITAFYLETLLLIAVFVCIILVLTQVFGLGRMQSGEAKLLTNAVCLAQNAAEAVSASDSAEALLALLDEGGNARLEEGRVVAAYDTDMRPDADGALRVCASWEPSEDGLVMSTVSVYRGADEEPLYTLETAVWLGEASA